MLPGVIGVAKFSSVKIAIEKMKLPVSVDRYILISVILISNSVYIYLYHAMENTANSVEYSKAVVY